MQIGIILESLLTSCFNGEKLAGVTGLEPATSGVTVQGSVSIFQWLTRYFFAKPYDLVRTYRHECLMFSHFRAY